MQPIGPTPAPAAQQDPRRVLFLLKGENPPTVDGTDLGDIDSGWVILKNSDVVSADLAAAAVCGGQRLGSSTIPSWARWVLGGVVYTLVPFYNRVRHLEDETVGFVENAVEVVEHLAEVTEKLAANVAKQLPEDGSLQKAVEEVEHIAEVVDDDAEKVEAVTEKIDKVSDEIDAAVEPVIAELEKELDQSTTSDDGVDTKN
ncbi:hypothetical protein ZEAMMB73_Zm00001d031259 [Zea mays]|uniref:Uncharacterized protein n=1 Tax=Zea mays TaxID=4577 RepID=A0A1D6KHQ7_MAIZE|nr:hypothetical protein ZEAMMB73_Zm00001d031259 [Zea mays]